MHDVAVVGGGIVGLATARALAQRGRSVVVLEREGGIGAHQTTHNSGVIHAGLYYAPGSLKARLCVEGAAALYAYCAEHGIAAERCGKLVVATREADLPRLDELERRSRANGVPDVARLEAGGIAAVEPAARGLAALHSPHTGMVAATGFVLGCGRDHEKANEADARTTQRVRGSLVPPVARGRRGGRRRQGGF
jgi:L-2-hydroxyglutarate oxidase LhgO